MNMEMTLGMNMEMTLDEALREASRRKQQRIRQLRRELLRLTREGVDVAISPRDLARLEDAGFFYNFETKMVEVQ